MPHFGLMEEFRLEPAAASLQRARLHIRGGKRRLRQGKISAGIATLFDAVVAAMEWYIGSAGRKAGLSIQPGENINDEKVVYKVLERSCVVDGSFDFDYFDSLTERALHEELSDFDYRTVLQQVETFMAQLHVMPFEESELPPEDPKTF